MEYKVGDRVNHSQFGKGKIIRFAKFKGNPFSFLVEFDNEISWMHDGNCSFEPVICGKLKHCWWFSNDDKEIEIVMKKRKADNYEVILFEDSEKSKATITIKFNKVIVSDRTMVGFYNDLNGVERKVKATCLPQDEFNFKDGLDVLSVKAMNKEIAREYKRIVKSKK